MNSIRVGLGLDLLPEFPLPVGPKRHTLREERRRGHAKAGAELQLYHGMRTRRCVLIGRARCVDVAPFEIVITREKVPPRLEGFDGMSLDEFAVADGFESFAAFRNYWFQERGIIEAGGFQGVIVRWEPLT